ncbi:AmmeMemoRadiSam system protein A [Clostridium vincentii]|uniref:2-aminophenol 1,6-dioxygenase subunit alpha n=1 Tax=Clostridium vincentii TaxID=52704 RepID=A0A2T0BBH4_9CLOT|nr:AmmeMemoRadiSam system protein A [Clostridium vincentii]PRR81157.1 2-aminophenol 1,6-dioxygenase subunit alpha [Clostridium vincentii]
MKNILGYYLMPHPPIIIPDIGKGEEKKIEKTSNACNKIGGEIAILKPETIVLITPHGTMFSDAIAISDENGIAGDLSNFGCSNIKMDIPIDREFNIKLGTACHLEGIPSVLVDSELLEKYDDNFQLDHGAMVPLYFINKYYNEYSLVHITYSLLGNMDLYKFGMEIEKVAKELDRKIVIIASGDLSHKLKEEGPYSYSPYGEKFDKEFLGSLEKGDVNSLFNMDSTMVEEAAQCGLNSVYILLGTMEGNEFKGELLSYEGPFGVGYGVMKFKKEEKESKILDLLIKIRSERLKQKLSGGNPYTRLARESLKYYFAKGTKMEDISNLPSELLNEKHGVFVSLKKFGALRGCIGTISPTTNSVGEEIIRNAIEAALADSRFPDLDDYELEDIDISVDVLMDAVAASKEDLDPKKYGVIVTKGCRRGLLLPDLEGVNTVEEQLSIACSKAGINSEEIYDIEKFEVIRYKEGE